MVKSKKVRLKDIAYALDVSVTCVSRSLRDCSDISEDTKKRIRAKAIELGYQSKYNELKTKEKFVVALILDSITNPYFTKFGDYLIRKLNKENYDFLIMITDPFFKVDDTLIKKCIYRNADIILSFNEFDEKAIELSKINNVPLVLIGRIPKFDYVNAFYTDDEKGGVLAFNHLVENGKKKLVYLEESRSEASLRRLVGFNKQVENYPDVKITIHDCNDLAFIAEEIKKDKIDGVFAYNDAVALNLVKVLKANNLENKNAIIVGYDDDIDYINQYDSSFKTITFDYDEVSDIVISIIKNKLERKIKNKIYRTQVDVALK